MSGERSEPELSGARISASRILSDINDRQPGEDASLGTNKNNPKDEGRRKQGSVAPINANEGMLKNANLTTPMLNYSNEFFVN